MRRINFCLKKECRCCMCSTRFLMREEIKVGLHKGKIFI